MLGCPNPVAIPRFQAKYTKVEIKRATKYIDEPLLFSFPTGHGGTGNAVNLCCEKFVLFLSQNIISDRHFISKSKTQL